MLGYRIGDFGSIAGDWIILQQKGLVNWSLW
jgi:hypothetical protein